MMGIEDFPSVVFRVSRGEAKSDQEWLKKKLDSFAKLWRKESPRLMGRIEEGCGEVFTNTAKAEGITVLWCKKNQETSNGAVQEDEPLKISLYLTKTDTLTSIKESLVHLLVHSLIYQKYQFHFRLREQTLFEDILADEFLASVVTLMVLGKKFGRKTCEAALDQAVQETAQRLSQKKTRSKLLNELYNFTEGYTRSIKNRKTDILTEREKLIVNLLSLLPETVYCENP
ncbi:MAG: hypothetical protein NWF04_10045 [Candidatus Bathyarchaeota archaeon]|nr:hypothetical protein [Candidatus Bathyarchaeota archaeon]